MVRPAQMCWPAQLYFPSENIRRCYQNVELKSRVMGGRPHRSFSIPPPSLPDLKRQDYVFHSLAFHFLVRCAVSSSLKQS